MTRDEYLDTMMNPSPTSFLKKYPEGDIMQFYADNPKLYSGTFGFKDDLHKYVGGHSGIDIVGEWRCPIISAHDGVVSEIKTDRMSLGGLTVFITSPILTSSVNFRYTFAYGHLDETVLKLGQQVKRGEIIGYMGNTGLVISGSTPYWGNAPAGVGTHLHFGIHPYEQIDETHWKPSGFAPLGYTIDPLPFLTGDNSGLSILLGNMANYLKSFLARLR